VRLQEINVENSIDIWGPYLETIRTTQDEILRMVASPAYQALLAAKNPANIAVESAQTPQIQSIFSNVNNFLIRFEGDRNTEISAAGPAMAASFVIGLPLIEQAVGNVVTGLGVEALSPTIEATNQILVMVPKDMAAELGLLGATMLMPFLMRSTWGVAVEKTAGGANLSELAYAQNFAREVLKIGADPNIVMGSVISQLRNAETLSGPMKEHLAAMVKLVLGVVALANLYSLFVAEQTQAGSGKKFDFAEDLKGMLNGTTEIPAGEVNGTIQSLLILIRAQLGILSPAERAKILTSIFEYLDSNPKTENLRNPGEIFEGVINTSVFNQHPSDAHPV
jgi:hypothetical protein